MTTDCGLGTSLVDARISASEKDLPVSTHVFLSVLKFKLAFLGKNVILTLYGQDLEKNRLKNTYHHKMHFFN